MQPEAIKEFNLSIVGFKKSQMAYTMERLPENVERPKQMSTQIKKNLGWVDCWSSKLRMLNSQLKEVYKSIVLMIASDDLRKEDLIVQEKKLNDIMEMIDFHL